MEISDMPRTKLSIDKCRWAGLPKLVTVAALLTVGAALPALAQKRGQKTFSSAEDASSAFVAAVQSNDEKAMLQILGPDGKRIVSSGDETEDASSRADFV